MVVMTLLEAEVDQLRVHDPRESKTAVSPKLNQTNKRLERNLIFRKIPQQKLE